MIYYLILTLLGCKQKQIDPFRVLKCDDRHREQYALTKTGHGILARQRRETSAAGNGSPRNYLHYITVNPFKIIIKLGNNKLRVLARLHTAHCILKEHLRKINLRTDVRSAKTPTKHQRTHSCRRRSQSQANGEGILPATSSMDTLL